MGGVWSRLRGKAPDYAEVLERLEHDIAQLHQTRTARKRRRRQNIVRLMSASVTVYAMFIIWLYYWYLPGARLRAWKDKALTVGPLLAFPVLVWGLKTLINVVYEWMIASLDAHIEELEAQKKVQIEELKEKTQYHKMMALIQRFEGPGTPAAGNAATPGSATSRNTIVTRGGMTTGGRALGTEMRRRTAPAGSNPAATPRVGATPMVPMAGVMREQQQALAAATPQRTPSKPTVPATPWTEGGSAGTDTVMAMPSGKRSVTDRIVDFFVGDGPNHRYALICSNCGSHNGLALPEDLPRIVFRCFACQTVNDRRSKEVRQQQQQRHAPGLQPRTLDFERAASAAASSSSVAQDQDDAKDAGDAAGDDLDTDQDDIDQADAVEPVAARRTRSSARKQKR